MLDQLRPWIAAGAHRQKNAAGDSQYAAASAVAISDELIPRLIRALYDPILAAGGIGGVGLDRRRTDRRVRDAADAVGEHAQQRRRAPGQRLRRRLRGLPVATLQQLLGQHPVDGFGTAITSHECAGGPSTCPAAVDAALQATYDALVQANGSSDVASWTASTASKAAGQTMPVFDAIQFRALGIVGQPAIDWQNRPTFQQVVQFPRHRAR